MERLCEGRNSIVEVFAITVGEVRQVASRSRLKRDVPLGLARSTRASPPSIECVGATGLPYRAVTPALFRALRVRIPPHPPELCAPAAVA